jgi:pimeloyl-ACP methyl ester carboxylesterase
MATLDRNGVSVYYEVHGRGPTLLLTHGFGATSQMWRGQIDLLSRDHTLVLWDMRGHGASAVPDDPSLYSETHTVGDMLALLDLVGSPRAIVGGLSLGGYMSLAFHRLHATRVRGLLIIDTGPGFRKTEAREAWNANARERGEAFDRDGLASLKAASAERAVAVHASAAGLAHAARGMLTQRDANVLESLPSIAVPTLIIVGADDTPFLAATDYMAAKIPGARKVVIPHAGHASNIDQPGAFNAAVDAFLQALHRD